MYSSQSVDKGITCTALCRLQMLGCEAFSKHAAHAKLLHMLRGRLGGTFGGRLGVGRAHWALLPLWTSALKVRKTTVRRGPVRGRARTCARQAVPTEMHAANTCPYLTLTTIVATEQNDA